MIFLCLASIWLTGLGLVWWMFPRPMRWSLHSVLLLSLGIGAGCGIVSCLWFLSLVAAGPNFPVWTLLLACAGIAGLALVLQRRPGTQLAWAEGPEPPWYLRGLFLLAIALAVTTFLVAVSNNPHGDEGAWSIWNLRARFLVRAGAFWRDAFSNDLSWAHPDYPLLLPGLVAMCWKFAGQESTGAPIAIAFLFAMGTVGLLTCVIGVLRGKIHALLGGTLLLGTAGFLSLSAAQYGDVPLSFYILATLALLCLQDHYPDDLRFSVLAGLMAGFGAWSRNEGVVFLIALIVARLVMMIRFRRRLPSPLLTAHLLRLALGLLAPLAVLLFFKLRVGGVSEFSSLTPQLILQHLAEPARWITTIQSLAIGLFGLGRFVVSIVLVLGLYWYLVGFRVEERDRAAVAALALTLVLTLAIDLVLDIALVNILNLELATGLERALLQLWPSGVLLLFLASGPLHLAPERSKSKDSKKALKHARRAAETR